MDDCCKSFGVKDSGSKGHQRRYSTLPHVVALGCSRLPIIKTRFTLDFALLAQAEQLVAKVGPHELGWFDTHVLSTIHWCRKMSRDQPTSVG